jgi:hypothetical protein
MAKNVFCGLHNTKLCVIKEFGLCLMSFRTYYLHLNLTTKKEAICSSDMLAHALQLPPYYEPKYHTVYVLLTVHHSTSVQ